MGIDLSNHWCVPNIGQSRIILKMSSLQVALTLLARKPQLHPNQIALATRQLIKRSTHVSTSAFHRLHVRIKISNLQKSHPLLEASQPQLSTRTSSPSHVTRICFLVLNLYNESNLVSFNIIYPKRILIRIFIYIFFLCQVLKLFFFYLLF